MPTWDDMGRASAIEANKRLERQSDIYKSGEPIREMHETLKDIKLLLNEILEVLKQDSK